MRVLEMECEGCGRLVRTAKDGDACGACDLALCHACLGGTTRCPSCQRRFADCRDLARVATDAPQEPRYLRVALLALLVIAIGFAYVSFTRGAEPTRPARATAERARASLDVFLLLGDRSMLMPPLSGTDCDRVLGEQLRVLENASRFRFAPPDRDDLSWALAPVLGALDAEVRPAPGAEGLPLAQPIRGRAHRSQRLVLFVDALEDPSETPVALSGGRLTGSLYLWDQGFGRMVCGAPVDHRASLMRAPSEGDAIGSGRVQLIVGALREGLVHLRRVVDGGLGLRGGG